MRAENVWWLPQSLRDGWRRRSERPSESHRDGRLLIAGDLQRPLTFLSTSLPLSFLPLDFRPSSLSFRPISSPCTGCTQRRAPPHKFPCLFFLFLFSFSYIAKDTRAILELQERRTAPEGSHMARHSGLRTEFTKACWQGRRQGSLEFLCRLVQNIYQLGFFIV